MFLSYMNSVVIHAATSMNSPNINDLISLSINGSSSLSSNVLNNIMKILSATP